MRNGLIALIGAGLIVATGSALAWCWEPGSPLAVLKCYEDAMDRMSAAQLDSLLASDYSLEYVPPEKGEMATDRKTEIETADKLFRVVRSIELRFTPPFKVERSNAPDSWRIETAGWVNRITAPVQDGRLEVREVSVPKAVLFVRQVQKPEPHFVLFKLINYRGDRAR